MPMPFRDKTGQVFGYWTVLGFAGRDGRNATVWNCKCICGTERNVVVGSLMKGKSKSCGCKQYEVTAQKHTKHGLAGTPTYKSWHSMIQRSQGKGGHQSYVDRKIDVCERWMNFQNFVEDMGIRPSNKTLDRIDNTKGYSKENCRWATRYEQSQNLSHNRNFEINGCTKSLSAWSREYKIDLSTLRKRLRKGMDILSALTIEAGTMWGNQYIKRRLPK